MRARQALLVSALSTVLFGGLLLDYLHRTEARVPVVRLVRNVRALTRLRREDLTLAELPPDAVEPGMLRSLAGALGKRPAWPLLRGDYLFAGELSPRPLRDGLGPGEVGLYLPVSLVSAAGARPGDRVDVLAGSAESGGVTTVASSVRVVRVLNSSGEDLGDAGTAGGWAEAVPAVVELAVRPAVAARIQAAGPEGAITLVQAPWRTGGWRG